MASEAQQEGLRLLKSIVDQARAFISDAGEFFPFASVLTEEGAIRPYGLLDEDSTIPVYLSKLQSLLDTDIHQGKFVAYALGVNVRVTLTDEDRPVDAVEIRLRHPSLDPIDYYMKYEYLSNQWHFYELVTL